MFCISVFDGRNRLVYVNCHSGIFNKMHNELTAAADNPEYSPALQAALSMGKALLNKHYSLSDDSKVYHIAMSTFS